MSVSTIISSLKTTARDLEAEYGNDNGVLAKQELSAAFDADALTENERKVLAVAGQEAGNTKDGLTFKGYDRALDKLKKEYRSLDTNHDGVLSGTERSKAKYGYKGALAALNAMVKGEDHATSGNVTKSETELRALFDEEVLQGRGEIDFDLAPQDIRDKADEAYEQYDPGNDWSRNLLKVEQNGAHVAYVAVVNYEDGFGHYTAFLPDGRQIKGDMEA